MTEEDEIWPAAHMLIGKFGEEAVTMATHRARTLLNQGAQEGGLLWIQIARAIALLEARRENRVLN